MTATTVNSNEITSSIAVPIVITDKRIGEVKVSVGTKTVATTSIDEVGDRLNMCFIPSNAVITNVLYRGADLDSHATPTLAWNIGLGYTGLGGTQPKNGKTLSDVISATCIASASTVGQAAVTTPTSVDTRSVANSVKEAWELGGLSSDPGGLLAVVLAASAAAATAVSGDVRIDVEYL